MAMSKGARAKRTGMINTLVAILLLVPILLLITSGFKCAVNGFESEKQRLDEIYIQGIKVTKDDISGFLLSEHDYDSGKKNKDSHFEKTTTKYVLNSFNSMITVNNTERQNLTINKISQLFDKTKLIVMLNMKIFLIRVVLVLSAIPLFLILGLIGLVDGLSQREIRRAELGRESSYIFHMLRKWIFKIIILLMFGWLVLPVVPSPQMVFIPLSVLFGIMISMTSQRFKKYL